VSPLADRPKLSQSSPAIAAAGLMRAKDNVVMSGAAAFVFILFRCWVCYLLITFWLLFYFRHWDDRELTLPVSDYQHIQKLHGSHYI
jgi:hypothetical protein